MSLLDRKLDWSSWNIYQQNDGQAMVKKRFNCHFLIIKCLENKFNLKHNSMAILTDKEPALFSGFNKCSHSRANILFTKSIHECTIMAEPCDKLENALEMNCHSCKKNKTCTQFGYSLSHTARGLYSLKTMEDPLCWKALPLFSPLNRRWILIPCTC